VFCTNDVCSVLRPGGGELTRHCVAGHARLNNVTWKRKKEDDRVAFEKDFGVLDQSGQRWLLEKIVMYNEYYHIAAIFEGCEIPFRRHRISGRMAVQKVLNDLLKARKGEIARWVDKFEDLRTVLNEQYDGLRGRTTGLRLEEVLLIRGEDGLRRGGFGRCVEAVKEQQKKSWASLMRARKVRWYRSEQIWKRAKDFMNEWTGVLQQLCERRNSSPVIGLTLPEIVTACILDSMLELWYTGREDSKARQLLSRCGLQEGFENGHPRMDPVNFGVSGAYVGANYLEVSALVRYILGHSIEAMLASKAKSRAEEMLNWKAELITLFDHRRSSFQQEVKLKEFFVRRGLPILYEDLARKLSRSMKSQHTGLKKNITGEVLKGLLTSGSVTDFINRLRAEGFYDEQGAPLLFVNGGGVSCEEIAHTLVEGALRQTGVFATCDVFPVVVRTAEEMRAKFEYENLGDRMVKESLEPYIALAIRIEKWIRFNRLNGLRSSLSASHFVYLGEVEAPDGRRRSSGARRAAEDAPVPDAEALANWITRQVDEVRGFSCNNDDSSAIRNLCGLIFDENVALHPGSDREKKASVLCAIRHVLKFEPATTFLPLYRMYSEKSRWNIKEAGLHDFWLQRFKVNGVQKVLFKIRKKGKKQLVPNLPEF